MALIKTFKALDKGKQKKGDWKGNLWYQEVGTYSVDPNHVDSDIFDSKVNLKGIAFKGQYMIEDNVKFNIAYAHGEINDKSVGCTPGLLVICKNVYRHNGFASTRYDL